MDSWLKDDAEGKALRDELAGLAAVQRESQSLCGPRRWPSRWPCSSTPFATRETSSTRGESNRKPAEATLVEVAEDMKSANFPLGPEKRITGLRLVAADVAWSTGGGPVVEGPVQSSVLMMAGGRGALDGSTGDGLPLLAARRYPAGTRPKGRVRASARESVAKQRSN